MDEEAAFEEGLEDVEELLVGITEAGAEALFDLGEGIVEVGADEGVDGATDAGDEEAVLALADEGDGAVGEVEGFLNFAVFVFEVFDDAAEVVADFARGSVA